MATRKPQQASRGYDYLVKLLLIGDSGVGKSCLLLRFADDEFSTTFITTIGIDFKVKTVHIEGKRVRLQIWDTAGQERFRTITKAYYRDAMGILLVYDVTSQETFDNITEWLGNINANADPNVKKVILGNKCDMQEQRVVAQEAGQQLAQEHGIQLFETSAKNNSNVEEAFMHIATDIKRQMDETEPHRRYSAQPGHVPTLNSPVAAGHTKSKCCSGGH